MLTHKSERTLNNYHGALTNRTLYGVDFSGAADAGKYLWIAQGRSNQDHLTIESCFAVAEFPTASAERDAALAALRKFIAQARDGVFGLDFPFSLPQPLLRYETWADFAGAFPDDYPTPDQFREHCRKLTSGRELKRQTDRESATPFCAYNLRMYRQTFYGMRDVLAPLVRAGAARVLPMQTIVADKALLLEVCPATVLKRRGLYMPYKGKRLHDVRAQILDTLCAREPLHIPPALRERLIANSGGDALDSVLAVLGTFHALRQPEKLANPTEPYRLEGCVYG